MFSVVEVTVQNVLNVGENISLRLMCREKGSLLAVPVNDMEKSSRTTFFSVSESFQRHIYSKLLLAEDEDVSY